MQTLTYQPITKKVEKYEVGNPIEIRVWQDEIETVWPVRKRFPFGAEVVAFTYRIADAKFICEAYNRAEVLCKL